VEVVSAIVERGGKLKDRVQINGRSEVHNEGVYYIEWPEDGQRRRQSVANRHHVLERARLKSLELDSRKAGLHADGKPAPPQPSIILLLAHTMKTEKENTFCHRFFSSLLEDNTATRCGGRGREARRVLANA